MSDRRGIHQRRVSFAGADAVPVFSDEANGIEIFQRAGKDGVVYEMAFSGMRGKPDYHYRFSSAEAAETHRATWVASKRASKESKQARSEQRRAALRLAGGLLKVGDVLVSSWGYEQTNYDYYQVTRMVGSQSVEIRELAQDKSYSGQSMTGECVPVKGRFIGAPMVKRIGHDGHVKVGGSRGWASKKESVVVGGVETFKPDHFTAYA